MSIWLRLNTLIFAALLGGCAFSEDTASVAYVPSTAPHVAGAGAVTLVVTDARTTNRTRISMKKNGYGMDGAAIRAARPVPDIVHDAAASEFQQRGFTLAPAGQPVAIAVDIFYAEFGNDIPTGSLFSSAMYKGDAHGMVALSVTAGTAYHHVYAGLGNANVFLTSGENAAHVLEAGLHDAMDRMFADPAFIAAITHAPTS